MSQDRKAIVLHGPATAGKSTISNEIQRRLGSGAVRLVSLDWGWDKFRLQQGDARYADVKDANERILIIEIGCGEPVDLTFNGATRGAGDWVKLLKAAGRAIYPFLLWVEWPEALKRIEERVQRDKHKNYCLALFWHDVGVWKLYEAGHQIHTFPADAGLNEVRIITTGRSMQDVTDEILRNSGIM